MVTQCRKSCVPNVRLRRPVGLCQLWGVLWIRTPGTRAGRVGQMLLAVSLWDPGKAWERKLSSPRVETHCDRGGDWLTQPQLRELGYTKVFSMGLMGLFTSNQGILLLGIESVRFVFVQCYATASQLTKDLNQGYFWQDSISSVAFWTAGWRWKLLQPSQTDHVASGHHTGPSTGTSNRPQTMPSIIDAMLLTRGRWQHNTSQVRWIFHTKAVQSLRTFLFEVWGMDDCKIGTCAELFTINTAIWKLE